MMSLLLKFEIEKVVKYFRTKTSAKIITSGLFMAVFIFVGFGVYAFFVSGIRYINQEAMEDTRIALSLFLYELFLLALSGVIVFSCMVSGLFNLFRGGYDNWIISSPGYKLFPRFVFIKSLLHSLVPSLVIFLPAVIAFTTVNNLGVTSLLFITLSVILLLTLLNAATLLLIVTISFLYYTLTQKIKKLSFTFTGFVSLLLFIIAVIALGLWKTIKNVDLVQLFKANTDSTSLSIATIVNHFNFLPTHPFAMEMLNWQINHQKAALLDFLVLSILTIICVFVWWYLSPLFYSQWQKFQDGDSTIKTKNYFFSNKVTYHFNGGKVMALFKKEILISSRNWKGVLWSLFLSFIWLAQIGANVIIQHNIDRYEPDIIKKTAILQTLQYIIAIYFISSFTLRFVFPSFSVERKTAWILASAPLSFTRIFYGKYLFYTLFLVTLGTVISYINVIILHLSFTYALYSIGLFISAIVFIVTLGLSLGAIFPSYENDDPEMISTSIPGLVFTALALIYGAVSDFALYLTLTKGNIFWLIVSVVVTVCGVMVFLVIVPELVRRRTFSNA